MQVQLRHISISHHKASADVRQAFYLSEQDQVSLSKIIRTNFSDIKSLMLLSTCNRVEVYFESDYTTAQDVLDSFLRFKGSSLPANELYHYFSLADETLETATHLMKVSNGLDSKISGDAQIITQVKTAYERSVKAALQGSLLERSIQTAFRLHKRISNETMYRKGSISFGLLSLKNISRILGRDKISEKKLLIVGAGEIAEEVAKYVAKFPFKEAAVTNRTIARAKELADKYQLSIADWSLVEQHQLQGYDAIITCVSNRPDLVYADMYLGAGKPMVFVDLAMPANIKKSFHSQEGISVIDLDSLSEEKDVHQQRRENAKLEAEKLLHEEAGVFSEWLRKVPVHRVLREYKQDLKVEIRELLASRYPEGLLADAIIEDISESLAKKLTRKPAKKLMEPGLNGHTHEYLAVFKELF